MPVLGIGVETNMTAAGISIRSAVDFWSVPKSKGCHLKVKAG
jgi:hypothetical protein